MDDNTGRQYLNALNQAISQMDPLARTCSTLMVGLGRVIAELLTRHDYEPIEQMRQVCEELFREAEQVKGNMRNVQ